MEVRLRLATLARVLVGIVALLALLGFVVEFAEDVLGYADPYDIVNFFGLSYEENLPTWFTVVLIASSGLVMLLIALGKRLEGAPYVFHWGLLAATFLYISLDELAQLHEAMSTWLPWRGVLYYTWIVPAGALLLLWLAAFPSFIRDLPVRTRNLFVVAGAVYVAGALGMELPLGWWYEQYGDDNIVYSMIDLVEETMEISAMCLFFYALVDYLAAPDDTLRIRFGSGGDEGGPQEA